MSKELALRVLILLSAMESHILTTGKAPDYLFEKLNLLSEQLKAIVLEGRE